MAPRGIVAGATASAFALQLARAGAGASHLLPIVFVVILGTVALYGLTGAAAARVSAWPGRHAGWCGGGWQCLGAGGGGRAEAAGVQVRVWVGPAAGRGPHAPPGSRRSTAA